MPLRTMREVPHSTTCDPTSPTSRHSRNGMTIRGVTATSRQSAHDVVRRFLQRPAQGPHQGSAPIRASAAAQGPVTPSRTYSGASTGAGPSTIRLIAVAVNGLPAFVTSPALASIPEMSRKDRRSPVFGLARRSRFASATASG